MYRKESKDTRCLYKFCREKKKYILFWPIRSNGTLLTRWCSLICTMCVRKQPDGFQAVPSGILWKVDA